MRRFDRVVKSVADRPGQRCYERSTTHFCAVLAWRPSGVLRRTVQPCPGGRGQHRTEKEKAMPQRFLRPGIRTSRRFNRCDWFSQILYFRLLTLVDDYGRHEAEPMLIRNMSFPLGDHKGKDVTLQTIVVSLQTLVENNLILLYEVADTKYLQLTRWVEKPRYESKCPPPANQSLLADNLSSSPSPSPSPSPSISVPTGTARFHKPSLEEVKLLGAKCGLPDSEAEKFFNHYESNGWKVGRNPMQSLSHAVANWRNNWKEGTYGNKTNRGSGGKRTDLNAGTYNEGKGHLYRNAAVKGMDDVRRSDSGKNATGGAAVPLGTPTAGQ